MTCLLVANGSNYITNPFPSYSAYLNTAYRPLFNGNISSQSIYNKGFASGDVSGGNMHFYNYRYDQLNRLTGQDVFRGFDSAAAVNSWAGMEDNDDYLTGRLPGQRARIPVKDYQSDSVTLGHLVVFEIDADRQILDEKENELLQWWLLVSLRWSEKWTTPEP